MTAKNCQCGAVARSSERPFGDMQDFEFAVQDGRLFMLQAWAGKRTAHAAALIALDMLDDALISRALALERSSGIDWTALAQRHVVAGTGAASPPWAGSRRPAMAWRWARSLSTRRVPVNVKRPALRSASLAVTPRPATSRPWLRRLA
jgi:hypothetical protein